MEEHELQEIATQLLHKGDFSPVVLNNLHKNQFCKKKKGGGGIQKVEINIKTQSLKMHS